MAEQRVTDQQLTEWEMVVSAATSGPWLTEEWSLGLTVVTARGGYLIESQDGAMPCMATAGDAAFVAAVREALPTLIAALRASRTQASEYFERGLGFVREAELVAAERDEMRANWQAAVATETARAAERDVLQHRIDTALAVTYASDDGTEYDHRHPPAEGEPECPACWAETIRAALTD